MKGVAVFLFFFCILSVVHGGWVQTFADEFNGQTSINLNKWNVAYSFSPTIINSETEYYTPDAFSFTPTTVKFLIENRPGISFINATTNFNYSSGVITTLNKFSQTYGYFEMSGRMPYGVGFWPAFWMLPAQPGSPHPFEIDVMEILTEDNLLHTTYHCDYNGTNPLNKGISYNSTLALSDGGFHTYSLQWIPGSLIFYFDKIQVFNWTSNCVPNTPEFLLANVAMGGWPKPPNNQTVFPNYMEVDYIRAWSYTPNNTVSFGGDVGSGIPFTPANAAAAVGVWNPTGPFTDCLFTMNDSPPVSALSAGAILTYSVTLNCRVPLSGGHIQMSAAYYNLTKASLTSNFITVNCSGTCTFSVSLTLPANTPNGYYIVSLQISKSDWSSIAYAGGVSSFGVGQNYTVGYKYAPANSASNSAGPSTTPVSPSRTSLSSVSRSVGASLSRSNTNSASRSTGASSSITPTNTASRSTGASLATSASAIAGASSSTNNPTSTTGGSSRLASWILFI